MYQHGELGCFNALLAGKTVASVMGLDIDETNSRLFRNHIRTSQRLMILLQIG